MMTFEIGFMLFLLGATLVSFVLEKIPAELTAMSAFAVLLVAGMLTPRDAMAVFSNPGPLAVAAMFVLSAALEKCGAIDLIAGRLVRVQKVPLLIVLPVMILLVALISAFINNTPVVVVFLPVVVTLARKMDVSASKLLIPLSYASIFGGNCTLIGTSTNIVVSSIAEEAGYPAFSMFELTAVGLPLLITGTIYLSLLGPRLLPVRETLSSILSDEERREYIVEAFVRENSPLVGVSLNNTSLAKLQKFRILEILRSGVKLDLKDSEATMKAGDRLLLAVSPKALAEAQNRAHGLDLRDSVGDGLEQISKSQGVIAEAVLGPDSSLIDVALGDINFRQRYRMVPLAVHRRGQNLRTNFERIPLEAGDTLLLLGTAEGIEQAGSNGDFLFLNRPALVLDAKKKKIPLIVAVIGGVIAAASLNLMPIATAAIVGCVILLLLKCLSTKEAYDSIQWSILFLIFAMLGVGAAMESTGTSAWLAEKLVESVTHFTAEPWRPFALLVGIYLLTTTLTEILSNNAAAVLFATLSIGIAESMQIDPRPFLIAITVAASASFATPIGYQTNTYVYGVGGYRFSDFAKIGIPLNLLAFIVAMIVIPMIWSF